jgi:L,D-transpeptidase catalytic domain
MAAIGDAGVAGDGGYEGPWIGSIILHAPIFSEMEAPGDRRGDSDGKSVLLGYLRYGQKVPVIPDAHRKANCPDGWYELLAGGFVCGKYATLDLDHPKFKTANPPDLDAALPYTYGYNLINGTPLYRNVPSRKERFKYEQGLGARPHKKVDDDNPYASTSLDAGAADADSDAAPPPWYLRETIDGGPPDVTLEDLEEGSGPVARRMVKGFFLSLDHQFDAAGTTWWKTVDNYTTPADHIFVAKQLTEFHGVWFGRDDATFPTKNYPAHRIDKLPVAFVLHGSKRWAIDDDRKHFQPADGALDRWDAVGLTGEKVRIQGIEFWQSTDGWWVRSMDVARTDPGPAPFSLKPDEKWIDVNLKTQTLVAFQGPSTPIYATLVSSGRNEHETVPGSFRIRAKHIAATMDADTASDGPYSIQDVPYIEYFNGSYALHGAFWHASFGSVKSHGCVNLAPWDAKALFGWTDPQVPEGWHAAYATKEHPGTRVIVHEKAPGTCEGPLAQPPECPDAPAAH